MISYKIQIKLLKTYRKFSSNQSPKQSKRAVYLITAQTKYLRKWIVTFEIKLNSNFILISAPLRSETTRCVRRATLLSID